MRRLLSRLTVLLLIFSYQLTVQAQTRGSIAGTVLDANGAVVPNATVTAKGTAGQELTATTADNGTYTIPSVQNGFYTVTITGAGFKTAVVSNVKVDVGTPATVDVALEVGAVGETVEVTSGGEVLQTQTANIGTNIQGRQITETPIQSRDALDLVVLLPGTTTNGTARTSTVNGLPKGSLQISIDGADAADSLLRSSDGFFTYVRPRIDAIDEVTVSTSNPGAESSGDGAVQIKFVTRRGTNNYTGGLYWQHRNEALNANYFFNNAVGLPRQKIRLNQYGGRFGGPIPFLGLGEGVPIFDSGKDKRFFFVNYEEYRIPETSPTRQRVLFNTQAQSGVFRYVVGNETRTINLYDLARANGLPSTPDPTVNTLLASIRSSTSGTGFISQIPNDVNRERFNFTNLNNQLRRFLAVRVDFNLTKNHSLENVFNYQPFRSDVDLLNSLDPVFPGFANAGNQESDRYSNSTALRSSFGQNIVNEVRFARLFGKSGFVLVGGTDFFSQTQRGFTLGLAGGINGITARNASQIRESPTNDLTNNLTWVKGSHTIGIGGQFKLVKLIDDNRPQFVPTVNFGILGVDPANSVFSAANFPGASAAQIAEAAAIYATLTGRVSSYTQTGYLGGDGRYVPSGPLFRELDQKTYGLYAQDSWRIKPNLTLSFGLRWQPQEGYRLLTENFARVTNFNQIFDVSGPNNLFSPGTLTGTVPTVTGTREGEKAYPTDYKNFAPSVGLVWSPDFGEGLLRKVLGESGRSVFRGGYSRAFVREGTNLAGGVLGNNPGGSIALSRTTGLGNFVVGTNFRDANNPNLTPATFSPTPSYPRTLTAADAALAFDPNLRTGYVDSYSVGYQRELDKDTVLEFRYVGNRGRDMFRLYSLNETNTIENGFAPEFRLAQSNLLANNTAGGARAGSFAYFGAGTGTSPLPIFQSFYRGAGDPNDASQYTSAQYRTAGIIAALATTSPNVVGLASNLASDATRRANAAAAGRPANFINNCPTTVGFCFLLDNSETSRYDSLQIELRRRLSAGLRINASYVYAKAFTNAFAGATSFAGAAAADQNNNSSVTLRNQALDKSLAQVDLRHAFKFDTTYDLPFGTGRTFFGSSNRLVNALVGGFSLNPVIRWQSGSPILLENVQLVGMTVKDLQKEIRVRKNETLGAGTSAERRGVVTYLPIDIITNTQRAFDISATSSNGYGVTYGGAPTGRFIAPAGYGNCQARFAGECGFRKLVIYGPNFFKLDTSISKKFALDEKRNVELRATMFDVLNRPNFRVGGWTGNFTNVTGFGAGFGELTTGTAYQDPFGSNDPGGRVIDLMLRINF